MASKNKSIVAGMSIQDILNTDNATFNKLGISDMRRIVGRLTSAANKRLRTFEKAGETSPAVRGVQRSGGKFSTKGKDLNALRAEYIRAKRFLESKTSTRRGWQSTVRKTIGELKKQGVEITASEFDKLWTAYEDLKEISPEVATRGLKYAVLKDISNMMDDKSYSAEEIASELHSKLDVIYEQRAALENGSGGVSDFFEI